MKKHLKVVKKKAQETIAKLRERNFIDSSYKIVRDEDYVYIPIVNEDTIINEYGEIVDIEGERGEEKFLPKKYSGSYDIIGDIVIIKYRETERAKELAENIMKFKKGVKSVYLDRGIYGEYRQRSLELLAGVEKTETFYKENGLTFKVDVKKVYFSPRLATERLRVAKNVRDGEFIVDMFAGVGPFSLCIAKFANSRIVAIDSNHDAISLLNENIKLNKLLGTVDGICADSAVEIKNHKGADRIIMNLPHGAHRFIESAIHSLKKRGVINYYEISDIEGIEKRMEQFRSLGLELIDKRVVHSYSKYESMHSIELSLADS